MTFGWASDTPESRSPDPAALAERYAAAGLETRYYTPELHLAAFALPRFVRDEIDR